MVREVDALTTITDEDRRSLGEKFGESRTLTLTPGFAGWVADKRSIQESTPRRVILMGSFRWVVKRENLTRFIKAADSRFHSCGIELDVIGDIPDDLLASLRGSCHATRFHGFVEDVAPLFASARIAVVPEAIGGGFKLKFLDYFFGRVPVATLAQAAAGLPRELRKQTLTCETLEELVEAVVAHIDRIDDLNRMQELAFARSQAQYTWEDRALKLKDTLERIALDRAKCAPRGIPGPRAGSELENG